MNLTKSYKDKRTQCVAHVLIQDGPDKGLPGDRCKRWALEHGLCKQHMASKAYRQNEEHI